MKTKHPYLSNVFFTFTTGFVLFLILSCNPAKKQDFNFSFGVCTSVKNAEMLDSAGYNYIEENVRNFLVPDQDEETFLKNLALLSSAALPVIACNGFLPGGLKSVGPDAVHPEILQFARIALRRAQQAGIGIIVFGSGGSRSIPEGFSHEKAREQFVSLLKQMAPIAGEYNVTIVLEPLRRGETNFINTVAEGAVIVREVGHPNFMLLADFYHMMMEDESPESIVNNADLIKHVHIAEKEGRAVPGTHGEDLTPYFKALKDAKYNGGISIEGRWTDMQAQASTAIQTMKEQVSAIMVND